MEIKEAVGILKSLQEPEAWEPQITEKTFEALDMAIIALEKFEDQSRFITIENNILFCIVVDRVTGVMYAVSNGNSNAGTFTPLVNADGKPLIYEKRMTITEKDLVKMGVIEPMEKSRAIELLEHLAWDRDIERNPYGDALNMAIEALKAQLSCEGTTSDTISRQAALDALDKRFDNIPMQLTEEILMLRKDLRELPAVQAELLDGEWVRIADLWRCNKCGCSINLKNPLDGNIWNYYFCPHCGTKMNIAVQRF